MNRTASSFFSKLLLALLCTGCANNIAKDINQNNNPKSLFEKGEYYLKDNNPGYAAMYFEQIEQEHPASDLAAASYIRHAYALYASGKYEESASKIREFIEQYPVHPQMDYVLYLKALCYYQEMVDAGRDQQNTKDALASFDELLTRFPTSQYAKDSKLKREFAFNTLAAQKMMIAAFYLRQDVSTVAAMGRYQEVIRDYQTSIFVPEALFRLVESYKILGVDEEAKKYLAVLGYNYPHSLWYKKAYSMLLPAKDVR